MCLVAGAWGDCSKDLHNLVQICAESKVEHICRSTGRPELEGQLSVIVSQYRRLLSTCIVRAHAQCLISRIGVISPQAREAARRREVAGRLERQLREDRRANWMASLRGPGSARGGRCNILAKHRFTNICVSFAFPILFFFFVIRQYPVINVKRRNST